MDNIDEVLSDLVEAQSRTKILIIVRDHSFFMGGGGGSGFK